MTEQIRNHSDSYWEELQAEQNALKGIFGARKDRELEEMIIAHENSSTKFTTPKRGDIVSGFIVGQAGGDVMINYGGKFTALLKTGGEENSYLYGEDGEIMSVGDQVDFIVKNISPKGDLIASMHGLSIARTLDELDELVGSNEPIDATITSVNRFGYNLDYKGVQLFMLHFNADVNMIQEDQRDSLIGKSVTVLVEEWSDFNSNYQVSRKRYLETLVPKEMEKLVIGNKYTGIVTGTTSYGIFVQFNKVLTGMIHKDNVHEEYRDRISDIQPGTEIEFFYKDTLKRNKIILTQYWRESAWDELDKGDVYEAVVESQRDFGYIVRIDWDTCGVIHNNNLKKANRKIAKGDTVNVKIESFTRNERKIYLTLA